MIAMQRRELFIGITGLLVTPALVRASSLMALPRSTLTLVRTPPNLQPDEDDWAGLLAAQIRDEIDQVVIQKLRELDRSARLRGWQLP